MSNNISINKKKPVASLNIDLTSGNNDAKNLGEEWYIDVEEPKGWFFRKFGMRMQKQVELKIENIKLPDKIKAETAKLFSIRANGTKTIMDGSNSVSLTLTSLRTSFSVFLEPSAITDCEKQQDPGKTYDISFTVTVADENGIIVSDNETVTIKFSEVHTRPTAKIKIDYKNKIFDNSLENNAKIGTFTLVNDNDKGIFPPIDCNIRFIVTAKDSNGTTKSFPDTPPVVRLDLDNSTGKSYTSNGDNTFTVKSLANGENISVPIIADYQTIGNPYDTESLQFDMYAEVDYHHSGKPTGSDTMKSAKGSFTVGCNNTSAELHVHVSDGTQNKEILSGKKTVLDKKEFIYQPAADQQLQHNVIVELLNTATNGIPGAGVVISNFSYSTSFSPDTTTAVYRNPGLTDKNVFRFSCRGNAFLNSKSPVCLYNSADAGKRTLKLTFGFTDHDIRELSAIVNKKKDYNVKVIANFSFSYWINNTGSEISTVVSRQPQTFNGCIVMPLYQKPAPNWLGVDFGTSAIVCAYAGNISNLHGQKKTLFAIPNSSKGQQDDGYELGTPFLSSNLIFRGNVLLKGALPQTQLLSQSEGAPDYKNLVVCLSPTLALEDQNSPLVLPCLKMMVGNKYLPGIQDIDKFLGTFYSVKNSQAAQPTRLIEKNEYGETVYTPLAHVDKLFEEVYRELFTYFILPSLKAGNTSKSELNRFVITVPNTYTLHHRAELKHIISQSLSDYTIRDICLVSESDAVACYYLKNRAALNKNAYINNQLTGRKPEDIGAEETILVYDMGAGTLDLTLFTRSMKGSKIEVSIIGKIGIPVAGNYLDSILAELLAKLQPKLKKFIYNINNADRLMTARKIKKYVRDVLKPALGSGGGTLTVSDDEAVDMGMNKGFVIDIAKDILGQAEFKQFIDDCTKDVTGRFFKFLGYVQCQMLDTVIISGRGSKLTQVSEALVKALAQWGHKNMAVINTNYKDTQQALGTGISKTCVVEGAMIYAGWKYDDDSNYTFTGNDISACYGVIYQDSDGADHYKEIFNPRNKKNTAVGINLSNTNELQLVQTYCADTEKEWNSGKRNTYISVVAKYNTQAIQNRRHAMTSIELDDDGKLILNINSVSTQGFAPNRIDLSNTAISKSMWPLYNQTIPQPSNK